MHDTNSVNYQSFPKQACLASVKTNLTVVNPVMENIEEIIEINKNLFISPSNIIDGECENLEYGILKDHHHRSVQLSRENEILYNDISGRIYSVLRLKGMGLFSGPFKHHLGKIRNIKNDETGEILGLQVASEIDNAMSNSRILLDMGIETELPIAHSILEEIILRHSNGFVERVPFQQAISLRDLPSTYKSLPFSIRVDAMGVNNRLSDFNNAKELFIGENISSSLTRRMLLQDTMQFLNDEISCGILDLNTKFNLVTQSSCLDMYQTISKRLLRNIGVLHKNRGVHGRMTPDNITMDGKFVDYDTLKWHKKDSVEFEEKRLTEYDWAINAIVDFGKNLLHFADMPPSKIQAVVSDLVKHVALEYDQFKN